MATRQPTASLREIAKQTKLSITTVSRVLRKQGEISDETRDRVLEAAKRLRYRPNLLVHGIRTGKTRTMGVVVPPYDSFWTQVLHGIHEELTAADHVYINAWCPQTNGEGSYASLLLKQFHRLIDRRVDGIILWAHLAPLYDERVVSELEARDLPVVTIDHELPFADSVETDEELGANLVARHLLQLGHRHVAHLAWDQEYKWAQLRRAFFEEALLAADRTTCETLVVEKDDDATSLTRTILSMKQRPSAIFACSDRIAKLVYASVKAAGLAIPDDISVVGFADVEYASWMQPGLTTVRQDGFVAGQTAARLLLERSMGTYSDPKPRRAKIECSLVERGSTAPPAKIQN
jgi:LacI family transcriptional regulator